MTTEIKETIERVYDENNIFAKILRGEMPKHSVYEDDKTLAFMDIIPMAKGHVLVIPKCAAVEISDMPAEYLQAVFVTAKKVMKAQRKVLNTEGIVQLQLNDQQAGQCVFHYHVHLVPTSIKHLKDHASSEAVAMKAEEMAELAQKLATAIEV